MSVKYNSVDRVGVHGMGTSIIRWLLDAVVWLKTGDTIAGFMNFKSRDGIAGFMPQVAVPVRATARIRTCASQGR